MNVPDHSAVFEFDFEVDPGRTMGRTSGKGALGPVVYDGLDMWRAEDLSDGQASLRIRRLGHTVEVDAWGPGVEAAVARVPELVGASDDPSRLEPQDPVVERWVKQFPHLRMTRTGTVWEHVIPTITSQKVPGPNARSAWQGILRRWGRRPPGPVPASLVLPPAPDVVAEIPYHEFHRFDLERRRASVIVECARRANRLEEAAAMEPPAARRRLEAISGIGPWSSGLIVMLGHGDADSLLIGDYQIPSFVAWHMAGERRATDDRMLELLEPYRGQRARVQAMAKAAGAPPRHGHRMALVDLKDR